MLRYLPLVLLAGCLREGAITCDDHTICPAGFACAKIVELGNQDALCTDPADFTSCRDLDPGSECISAGGGDGTCFEAAEGTVCIPRECGDGLRDLDEVCDDANRDAGDECSADCKSDESCGNNVLDGIAFEQCDDGNLNDHDGCDSRCRPERAVWTELDLDRMPPRFGAAMAFDISRGVAVLFGGRDATTLVKFDDTWLWNGASWSRVSPPTKPSPRTSATMVYDSRRGRILLFGGTGEDGTLGDTWEWDGATWNRRTTPTAPTPREKVGLAYDSKRKRTVLFGGVATSGGITGPVPLDDTWEWDGTVWTQIQTASSPSARSGHGMAYDPSRGKVVVFGGQQKPGLAPAVVWEFDGANWTSITPGTTPPPRTGTRMAWDAKSQTTLLFGGTDANGEYDDLWSWNGTAWSRPNAVPRPPPRTEHAIADDPIRGRLIVTGGVAQAVTATYEWNGTTWTSGVLPNPVDREYHQSAYDPLRRRAVLIDDHHQTWESDGRSWIATTAPTAPTSAAMTYDPERARIVAFSGNNGSDLDDTTLLWDGVTWTPVAASVRPTARGGSAMAYDVSRNHAVMFGGFTDGGPQNDTWIWDANGWHVAAPVHVPPSRESHVMGYDPLRKQIVMFGGLSDTAGTHLNDTWVWTGTDWEDRSGAMTTRPAPRAGSAIAYDGARRRLVMFGGGEGIEGTLQDLWEWGDAGWTPIDTDSSPAHRIHFAMFPSASGAGIVVFGGNGAGVNANTDDHWQLRWENARPDQACNSELDDQDQDGVVGCADLDCWSVCTPLCPPGGTCALDESRCGDGTCAAIETCRSCPGDCGACTPLCGDAVCDPGETCAGECP